MDDLWISSLNQFCYCPYRFYLMYVERVFEDNEYTVAGTLHHESTSEVSSVRAGDKVVHRRVFLHSERFGLRGIADLIEVYDDGRVVVIEHKEGRKGRWFNDRVQLCAQALCLEEMLNTKVEEGSVFYRRSGRRERVVFDHKLREETLRIVEAAKRVFEELDRPKPKFGPRCKGCSLKPFCLPEETGLLEEQSGSSVRHSRR